MKDVIYSINGPVVTVKNTDSFSMLEMVYVGEKQLLGEVISVNDKLLLLSPCKTVLEFNHTKNLWKKILDLDKQFECEFLQTVNHFFYLINEKN